LDGWCNYDRPRDRQGRWLTTRDEWCIGVDNCKFVANPLQERTPALSDVDGDGDSDASGEALGSRPPSGDACNTGTVQYVLLVCALLVPCVAASRNRRKAFTLPDVRDRDALFSSLSWCCRAVVV
jgi:hypothetical protein